MKEPLLTQQVLKNMVGTKQALLGRVATLLLAATASAAVLAADPENGKELYHEVEIERTINGEDYTDADCETCHDPQFYSRSDRKVTTYAKLVAFVEGCNTNLDVGWFPEDVADVAAYMNEEFYQFKQ